MYKCQLEVSEYASRNKQTENATIGRLISRRLRFDELAIRDRAYWLRATTTEALRAVVGDVKRELAWGEFDRFTAWAIEHLGLGLARSAGLVQGPPRLFVSA